MYSRSYYPEGDRVNLPENYDGTAFMERSEAQGEDTAPEVSFSESTDTAVFKSSDEKNESAKASANAGLPFLSGLFGKGGMLGGLGLRVPNIGTEEILILATAAFLFFSKNGDRECALILLLLLFIN